MKNTVIKILAVVAAIGFSTAQAQYRPGPYVGVGLGASFPAQSEVEADGIDLSLGLRQDTGAAASIFGGVPINDKFAVELESIGRAYSSDIPDFDLGVSMIMVNGVVNLSDMATLKTYVGAGIGLSRLLEDGDRLEDYDGAFAFQFKVGAIKPIARRHGLGLEAVYRGSRPFRADAFQEEVTLNSVDVMFTYRYQSGGWSR
ncbi:MAG: outer membrane beta-barrel protein [Pseudomonadota bacterium]